MLPYIISESINWYGDLKGNLETSIDIFSIYSFDPRSLNFY